MLHIIMVYLDYENTTSIHYSVQQVHCNICCFFVRSAIELLLVVSVAAISTPGRSLCKTPLLSTANEIAHEECGQHCVM